MRCKTKPEASKPANNPKSLQIELLTSGTGKPDKLLLNRILDGFMISADGNITANNV